MTNRAGLVPVKKTVVRDGKTYLTTVYVKTGDTNKVQQSSQVNVPDWHFKDAAGLESEVSRINGIKDPSEKKVLKDHLVADLRKNGIDWKVDTGTKAESINWMRALMAAKKHLKAGNQIEIVHKTQGSGQTDKNSSKQPSPSGKQKDTGGSKVVLGTGKPMSKEEAKKAVADLRGNLGVQGVMDLAEKNGVQWAKNPNHVANSYMQCAMKLSKHLQSGGVLTDSGKPDQETKAPKKDAKPVVKVEKNVPEAGTIEHDYYQATPHMKLIGMATGILPTDEATKDYLLDLIKTGKFDIRAGGTFEDFKLPKAYAERVKQLASYVIKNPVYVDSNITFDASTDNLFKGSPHEDLYKKFKKDISAFDEKFGKAARIKGVDGVQDSAFTAKLLDSLVKGSDFSSVTNSEVLEKLATKLHKLSSSSKQSEKFWDENNMDNLFVSKWLGGNSLNPVSSVVDLCTGNGDDFNLTFARSLSAKYTRNQLMQGVQSGSISKGEALSFIADSILNHKREIRTVKPLDGQIQTRGPALLAHFVAQQDYTSNGFKDYCKQAAKSMADITSSDANYVKENMFLVHGVNNMPNASSVKSIADWKPMDRDLFSKTRDKATLYADHIAFLRKNPKQREKHIAERNSKALGIDYVAEVLGGSDGKDLYFPEHKDARKSLRASLGKMGDKEAKKVADRIHASHDTVNHRGFKTQINGVYEIKNLPIEKSFNDIDKARNNTNFYYHGTGYSAAQKIVGGSGQFVVTKTNVKAGRMLGDGVYLANNSSKSMQYASDDYSRNTGSRGVLYLCKASLGKVTQSRVRGSDYNTKLLKRQDIDTVFMDRPDVLNPEWSVKEEKAVIPKLWIDVVRVQP
ncbi:Poly(ADP-ribose) polymerase catalytic domain protein [compost metagenome]